MIRWLIGVPLLGLAIGVRVPVPLENLPRETFSTEAIGASIARIQPVVERALGKPLNEVDYRIVSPSQITSVLAREMTLFVGHPRERRAMDRWAEPLSRATSQLLFAKVELETARINLVPATFRRLDDRTRGRLEIRTAPFRDAVLAHELVHVYQFRRVDGAAYFGRCKSLSEFQGPGSVIEGHAQFIGRRVAAQLDLEEPFGNLTGLASGDFEDWSDEARARARMSAGLSAFPYYRGHQLVERVVLERGYEAAMKALFEDGPRSQMDVTVPARYLPPDAEAKAFARVLDRVERYLQEKSKSGRKLRSPGSRRVWKMDEDRDRTYSEYVNWLWGRKSFSRAVVCSVDFRLGWSDVPIEEVARRHRGVIAGVRFEDPDHRAVVTIYRCVDEDAAQRWCADPFIGVHENRHLTWQIGKYVLVLGGRAGPWINALRELIQSADKPSPWTGKPRAEYPAIFLKAAQSEDWGLRWRAVRNLGRLDKDTPGVRDGVLAALRDEDSEIRLEALHALIVWEVEGELDEETLTALRDDDSDAVRELAREIR